MTEAEGSDRSLVYNLTNLEINTIIKENLTARKMPDPANAVLDVALTYAWKPERSRFRPGPMVQALRRRRGGRGPGKRQQSGRCAPRSRDLWFGP